MTVYVKCQGSLLMAARKLIAADIFAILFEKSRFAEYDTFIIANVV